MTMLCRKFALSRKSSVLHSPSDAVFYFNDHDFRLKDNGDGLTGPQPSILGSVDKVFNKVNQFDQYQCLQVSSD